MHFQTLSQKIHEKMESFHNRSIDWKVFDVSVSGVSLVKTYRASFQSIANSEGIDGLIGSLKEKNEKFGNL